MRGNRRRGALRCDRDLFYNNRFTNRTGIPAATEARFTRLLLDAGLLQTVRESAGRQSAIYRFEPLMELVRV